MESNQLEYTGDFMDFLRVLKLCSFASIEKMFQITVQYLFNTYLHIHTQTVQYIKKTLNTKCI